ncbi:protein kinase family protein [Viridibacillus sp. YIM B01967]|uniref:Protein kinase family protein n=1 Tax=Viridibacillus soli TaxID=2798301 RepID=A0ABS1H6E4_9BACL|nr:protein kinase family protein [Viridibacillus soli]MBK3494992.1 protein kinase family protein [Viridibacillus soli]
MDTYETLSSTVIIDKKNRLMSYSNSLKLIGTGRSAFVFKVKSSNKAIKIFFPNFTHIAKEEAEVYQILQGITHYPSIYDVGFNYIVIDYVEGYTLFECITHGKAITSSHIKEIDYALSLASARGLNPSDIHLRNIIIASNGEIKLIDVARFRQTKDCKQWHNLKKAYRRHYHKRYFPKKVSATILNKIAFLYKKGLIPTYRI